MYEFSVDPALLLALVAGALALAFDYLPKVRTWFDGLDEAGKRIVNAALILGAAVVIFVGDCYGLFATNLECTIKGGADLLYMVFLAATVNHGVHALFKPSQSLERKLQS